jgi:hypothetical protein
LASEKLASKAIWFIAFYPTSVFFSSIYTESLYILLTSLYIYTLEKESYLQSGFLGFLAGLTRPEGFLLCIPTFIKALTNGDTWNRTRKLGSSILAASSLFAILILAQFATGDYRAVFSSELGWENLAVNDLIADSTRIEYLFRFPDFLSFWIISIPTVTIGAAAIFMSLYRSKKDHRWMTPYYFHAMILTMAYLVVGDFRSIPRFISTLVPMYWTLSLWYKNHPKFGKSLLCVFGALCIFGTILFTNWYHFQ